MLNSVPGVPRVQKWNALPACTLLAGIPFKGPASLWACKKCVRNSPIFV